MRKSQKTARQKSTIPAGFRDTSGGGDFPAAWIPKEGDVLMGTCHSVRVESAQKLKREKAKKGDTVRVVVVADADGVLHTVFESKALEAFCKEVKPGDEVYLKFLEQKKIGKKRFNVYESGIKSKGRK